MAEQNGCEVKTIRLRPAQMQVFRCDKRFRVLVAGRRFGKTHLALVEMLRAAVSAPRQTVWYVAPTYRQAKQIAWTRLKDLTRPFWSGKPNESELSLRLQSGSVVALRGADRPDSLRGSGLDFVVLDEYASMRPECWSEVLRPALSDRQGGALFIGTPQGSNHLMERFEQAKDAADWSAFQFTTLEGGNVTAAELASAAKDLDERQYRQEFEASFEGAGLGRAYYAFSRTENVQKCEFQRGWPLIWSLDFNVNPMCSVVAQAVGDVRGVSIQVLDEMVSNDANTPAACQEFLKKTWLWREGGSLHVHVYGDASGYQRRTSGSDTDWGLIREFFGLWKGEFNASLRASKSNPGVRDRVNLVNSRLQNALGERSLFVDPKCRELIKDLEAVRWANDATGRATSELDKSDRLRTHVSDALGYYVAHAFPMRLPAGPTGNGPLF